MEPELILNFTTGLPGTGKTTWVKEQVKKIVGSRFNVMVSHDQLCRMLNAEQYGPNFFTEQFWRLYSQLKTGIVDAALGHGFNVYVDGTHGTVNSRARLIGLAKHHGATVICHFFHDNKQFGLRRKLLNEYENADGQAWNEAGDNATAKDIQNEIVARFDPLLWIGLYNKFAEDYVIPEFSEGIDVIYDYELDGKSILNQFRGRGSGDAAEPSKGEPFEKGPMAEEHGSGTAVLPPEPPEKTETAGEATETAEKGRE